MGDVVDFFEDLLNPREREQSSAERLAERQLQELDRQNEQRGARTAAAGALAAGLAGGRSPLLSSATRSRGGVLR